MVIPPMIERRKSKIAGWGVYATQPIPKNKRIIHYAGEKITHKESLEREQKYLAKGRIWCFTLNRRWVIDAGVGGNIARFVNHSCKPNCWIDISGTLEHKIDALFCHASQLTETGEWFRQFLRDRAEEAGREAGVAYAEGFRRLSFGG